VEPFEVARGVQAFYTANGQNRTEEKLWPHLKIRKTQTSAQVPSSITGPQVGTPQPHVPPGIVTTNNSNSNNNNNSNNTLSRLHNSLKNQLSNPIPLF